MNDIDKIKQILDDHENRIKLLEGTSKLISSKSPKVEKKSSGVFDYLMDLKEEGFFDEPKLLKEIVQELARRGYHYKSTSLTNPLQRALRKNRLGRIGKSGNWQYVKR